MNRTKRLAAPAAAVLLLAGLAAPAFAQQVILFGTGGSVERFAGYTVGAALPTGGDWASATNVTIQNGAAAFRRPYAYFASASGTAATRQADTTQIAAGSYDYAVLKFWIRYERAFAGQNGTRLDGTLVFDEFPASLTQDAISVEYSTDGSTWTNINTFPSNGQPVANGSGFRGGVNVAFKLPSGAFSDNLQIRFTQSYGGTVGFGSQWAIDDVQVVNPEPGTWALFGLASLGLTGYVARRRRQRAASAKTPA